MRSSSASAIPFREIAARAFTKLPQARGARPGAVRRPGVPLQRRHLRPRHAVQPSSSTSRRAPSRSSSSSSRSSNFLGPLLLGRLFDTVGRKPMIAGTYLVSAARDRRSRRSCSRAAALTNWGFMAFIVLDVLLRLGRRQRRLPDGQRDLPDGDPGARDRVLLRRRHRRSAASPARCCSATYRQRRRRPGRDRLLHRRGGDGARRDRRDVPRGPGRAGSSSRTSPSR